MRRREFIAAIGNAAAWPFAARAQAMPVIGVLGSGSLTSQEFAVIAFRRGLNEAGYVEGQNVAIEYRWSEGAYDRAPSFAAEFVRRRVALIVVFGATDQALAAKAATSTIPVLFFVGTDPVAAGLVKSLGHPGGNLTGITNLSVGLAGKRLEVLRDLVPKISTVGYLVDPASPATPPLIRETEAAARSLGIKVVPMYVQSEAEFDSAFDSLVRQQGGGFVVGGQFYLSRRQQIIALAKQHALPAVYSSRAYVVDGGLLCYGTDNLVAYVELGRYAGRVLKGEKPADLPVLQTAKFELVINLKTAKALGLEVPLTMLYRADEVIE